LALPKNIKKIGITIIEKIPIRELYISVNVVNKNEIKKDKEIDEETIRIEVIVSDYLNIEHPYSLVEATLFDSTGHKVSKIFEHTNNKGIVLIQEDLKSGQYLLQADVASQGFRLLHFKHRFEIK
jgi:hypothetical protein